MTGKVIKVNTSAKVKDWDVTALTVSTAQGENTYNFFKSASCIGVVNKLQPGQTVELEMEKKGKFWNPKDVKVISAPTPESESKGESGSRSQDIRRSVALKAAVDLYAAVLKSLEQADLTGILITAHQFEIYLETGFNPSTVVASTLDGDEAPF